MNQEEIIHRMLDFLKRGGSYRYHKIIEQSEGLINIPREECYTAIRTMKSDLLVEVDRDVIQVGEFIKITDLGVKVAANGGYLQWSRQEQESRELPITAAKSTVGFNKFMSGWGYVITTAILVFTFFFFLFQYFIDRRVKSNLEQSQSKIEKQQVALQAQLDSIKRLHAPVQSKIGMPVNPKK